MAKALRLNSAIMKADYIEAMSKALDEIAHGYFTSVVNQMRTQNGASDVTVEGEDEEFKLVRKIIGGVWAVMDSWGTGSLADVSNPAWQDYMNSDLWNPERPKTPGAPITGRPKGTYTDIFGEQQESSGRFAGVPLEGFLDSPVKPQAPSGAFRDTDAWFVAEETMIEKLNKATTEFFSSVRRNPMKYFTFG